MIETEWSFTPHEDRTPEAWPRQTAERAWYRMSQIRAFEEVSIEMYKQGLMGGSLHSYMGQEAVATGCGLHLNADDYMTMTYRGRGQALAKGADPFRLFAEMLGRVSGYCKGKGGPMHIASGDIGMLGANGIVGGGIPIAVGAAMTAKRRGRGQVAVTFFGDGAVNQGVFFESLNLAAVLQLPVIFVCENNLYAEMTPIRLSVRNEHLAERGFACRVPSVVVDGNDILAVYAAAGEAVGRARNGGGPALIEAKTYRLMGHMFGDTESYRTREEVAEWRKRDPLLVYRERCAAEGWLDAEAIRTIADRAAGDVRTAYERALQEEQPGMEEIWTDVG